MALERANRRVPVAVAREGHELRDRRLLLRRVRWRHLVSVAVVRRVARGDCECGELGARRGDKSGVWVRQE